MSADERRERVLSSIVEQFRSLLETRYPQILKAATDSFQDDTDAVEPTCKVNALIEWDAMAPSTKNRTGGLIVMADPEKGRGM